MTTVQQPTPEDQISPKELLKAVVKGFRVILKYWWLVLLLTAGGFLIGLVLDKTIKNNDLYSAAILFNMSGNSGGSAGGGDLAAAAALFGGGGGSADGNLFSGENFFIFAKSTPVLTRGLMKEKDIFGKKMILANLYIDSSGIKQDDWEKMEDRHSFHFTHTKVDSFSMREREILNSIVGRIAKETNLGQPEKKSSFLELEVKSENRNWTKLWTETYFDVMEEVYNEYQTRTTMRLLNTQKNRLDSITVVLGRSESSVAVQTDQNEFIPSLAPKVSVTKKTRDNAFLQGEYTRLRANVETLKTSLIKEAPVFTIIEPIKLPLEFVPEYSIRSSIGMITGFLLSLLVIYLLVTIREIRSELKQ